LHLMLHIDLSKPLMSLAQKPRSVQLFFLRRVLRLLHTLTLISVRFLNVFDFPVLKQLLVVFSSESLHAHVIGIFALHPVFIHLTASCLIDLSMNFLQVHDLLIIAFTGN